MKNLFSVNDLVFYPSYGVAKITRELIKTLNDVQVFFYELKFISRDVVILVPALSAAKYGLRHLSTKNDVSKIFDSFCRVYPPDWVSEICSISWNRRSKDYLNKIRGGSIVVTSEIYRDLLFIDCYKPLSFGEKSIFSQVENLLCEEYSIIYGKVIDDVKKFFKDGCSLCLRYYNIFDSSRVSPSPDSSKSPNPFLIAPDLFFKEMLAT